MEGCAELLRVTPRTVWHWEGGDRRVPYAAFKLLRILKGYELPHPDWSGWTLHRGTLYTPAGQGFRADDLQWLSLVFRRAEAFSASRRRSDVAPPAPPAGRGAAARRGTRRAAQPTGRGSARTRRSATGRARG